MLFLRSTHLLFLAVEKSLNGYRRYKSGTLNFSLSHVPEKYRLFVSKFIRRVIIARMAESPDLASAYHSKLRDAYDTEDKLRNLDVLKRSKEHLVRLLDEVETKLSETAYLAGEEFTMADVMLIPVLARLVLLNLEDEYIGSRPKIAEYWNVIQQRPSYKKVKSMLKRY
ncbi:hypothetical protein L1049_007817 [Liquidambar formosana]|uniref:GST C-terminal domain-containing protein n=1 Tax=Liquidambar formosana TaxID=63359 RepID=A0AAP0X1V6_LIQFO